VSGWSDTECSMSRPRTNQPISSVPAGIVAGRVTVDRASDRSATSTRRGSSVKAEITALRRSRSASPCTPVGAHAISHQLAQRHAGGSLRFNDSCRISAKRCTRRSCRGLTPSHGAQLVPDRDIEPCRSKLLLDLRDAREGSGISALLAGGRAEEFNCECLRNHLIPPQFGLKCGHGKNA